MPRRRCRVQPRAAFPRGLAQDRRRPRVGCREHLKMSGLRSTSHVRSGADALWAGSASRARHAVHRLAAKRTYAAVRGQTGEKDARRESFAFLGYTLGPRHFPSGGRWYLGASPSKQSVQRVKAKISELLVPGNKGAWDEVRARLNRILRGWSAYFAYGALASAYEAVDRHVYDRARNFLRQRHK